MKKNLILATLLLMAISFAAFAQKKPVIQFESLEFDFGKIHEEAGKVKGKFTFKNVGDDTLRILTVKPGCGCTTAEWTQTPVLPKKSGFIIAEYDPKNRPGLFNKGITVTTNDPAQPSLTLTIKGDVIPKPKTFVELYPVTIGKLRFESSQYNFGNVKNTEIRVDTMKVYNEWKLPMNIAFSNLPEFIKMKAVPTTLKPNTEGLLIITYDASKRQDFGYLYDRVQISTNDSLQPEKTLNISLNMMEDFSNLTPEQLANAPKIKFKSIDYSFPDAKAGEQVQCTYEFTNEGKSDLVIRKVKASCGCTATNPEKTILKPGESSKISATLNTTGREGKQYKTITVMCNDPANSTIMLTLQGNVIKPAPAQ